MKKIALTLFAALALLACNHYDYTLSGDAVNTNINDSEIFLAERIGRQYINIDSAKVEDGKFLLQGNIDTAKIVFLIGQYKSGESFRHAFVLEKGNILVTIDSSSIRFAGTPENENLQLYSDQKTELYTAYDNFTKTYDSTFTAEQEAAFTAKLHEFDLIDEQQDLEFAFNNINTVAGTHVFTSSAYYYLGIAERDSLFALMTEKTKAIPAVKLIIENTEILRKTAAGQQFSDFAYQTPEGETLALSALIGKSDYVLIDFWASWCGPCINSFPEVRTFYQKYKGKKLEILGVSLDKNKESWIAAIAKHKLAWKHVSDLKYWDSEPAKLYGVRAIPSTVLIDKNGIIAGRNLDIQSIEKLLLEKH
ncbi:MAG: AhpC/TSA family protein [Paludibacter sp.]|jgi:peroxiredoxin|nr:AhpC/TSA family protein [Paludibacter sp.]